MKLFEGLPNRIKKKIIINPKTGCYEWTGAKNKRGYGLVGYKRKVVQVHRLVYMLTYNKFLTTSQFILHSCHNPSCSRIEHLREGTAQDNSNDMVAAGRQSKPKGSAHGHSKLTEQDIPKIRKLLIDGFIQREIADLFGVQRTTISDIKHRRTWTHVKV